MLVNIYSIYNIYRSQYLQKTLLNCTAAINYATNFKTQLGLIRKAITELPLLSPQLHRCKPEPNCCPWESSAQAKGSPRHSHPKAATALRGFTGRGAERNHEHLLELQSIAQFQSRTTL